MDIRSVRRWVWMLGGLVAGALLAETQRLPSGDWVGAYGDAIAEHEFEADILREYQGVRHFTDLAVYPRKVTDVNGEEKALHIVAGKHFNGKLESVDGQMVARWKTRCFVAESPFYVAGKEYATVMGYLDAQGGRGVEYRYAWWQEPKWARVVWIGGVFGVVGLVWPTVLYLYVFGRWWNPPRGEVDFLALRGSGRASAGDAGREEMDLSGAAAYAAELEAAMGADAVERPAGPGAGEEVAETVRRLSNRPADAPAMSEAQESKAFGAKAGDFYPTELRGGPGEEDGPPRGA